MADGARWAEGEGVGRIVTYRLRADLRRRRSPSPRGGRLGVLTRSCWAGSSWTASASPWATPSRSTAARAPRRPGWSARECSRGWARAPSPPRAWGSGRWWSLTTRSASTRSAPTTCPRTTATRARCMPSPPSTWPGTGPPSMRCLRPSSRKCSTRAPTWASGASSRPPRCGISTGSGRCPPRWQPCWRWWWAWPWRSGCRRGSWPDGWCGSGSPTGSTPLPPPRPPGSGPPSSRRPPWSWRRPWPPSPAAAPPLPTPLSLREE